MIVLTTLLNILIFPGFLFASFIGLLLAGLDRKVLARMQHRIGPPIIQPMYDFFKLCGKETIIPAAANRHVYMLAPWASLCSLIVMCLFIPIGGLTFFSGNADLIVIIYLLTIPGVCLIVGGSSSGSPYAAVGISREMVTMIAYELPLVIVFLAIARVVGQGELVFSVKTVAEYQLANGALISHIALIPAAIAFLLVIPAEVGTQPFDTAEAETEICEGPLVEYSGKPLALFKLNSSLKMFIMSALFTTLFIGVVYTGIVVVDVIIFIAICCLVTIICMTLVHAVTARLKIEHLFKFYWTVVAGIALLSLILVWAGL